MSRRHRRVVAVATRPAAGLANNTLETYESANVLISDLLGGGFDNRLPMPEMVIPSKPLLHSTRVGPRAVLVEPTHT